MVGYQKRVGINEGCRALSKFSPAAKSGSARFFGGLGCCPHLYVPPFSLLPEVVSNACDVNE